MCMFPGFLVLIVSSECLMCSLCLLSFVYVFAAIMVLEFSEFCVSSVFLVPANEFCVFCCVPCVLCVLCVC